jgi:hypothetical protein
MRAAPLLILIIAQLLAFKGTSGAQDFFSSRVFQFQQELGKHPVARESTVTLADTEKRAYISGNEKSKAVYFSVSEEAITIFAGGQPIVFTGEAKKKILKGGFLTYREGAIQLFATSEPDIDYILIGYDKMARISTIVHLKKAEIADRTN